MEMIRSTLFLWLKSWVLNQNFTAYIILRILLKQHIVDIFCWKTDSSCFPQRMFSIFTTKCATKYLRSLHPVLRVHQVQSWVSISHNHSYPHTSTLPLTPKMLQPICKPIHIDQTAWIYHRTKKIQQWETWSMLASVICIQMAFPFTSVCQEQKYACKPCSPCFHRDQDILVSVCGNLIWDQHWLSTPIH